MSSNHSHDCDHFGPNFTSFQEALKDEGNIYQLFTITIDMRRIVLPILYIIGVPGAILSFVVWTRPRMKHSSSIYLAALAIMDLSFFIANFLYYLSIIWGVPVLAVPIFCEIFSWIHYFLQIMSPCLTLGFTIERYTAIYYPYSSAEWCTISRAVKLVVIMSIINILVAAPQAYFFQAQPERFFGCELRPSIIDHHTSLYKIYTVWSLASESVIFGVIPIVILIFNIRVIQVTRRLSRYIPGQSPRFKSENKEENVQQRHQVSANATTFMLLCVSFYLIFSTLPTTLCQLLVLRFYSGEDCLTLEEFKNNIQWKNHFTYVNVKTIVEAFSVTHYAAKFYIYLATGRQFRKECKAMLKIFSLVKAKPNDTSIQTHGLQTMQNDCAANLLSNNHNKQENIPA